MQGQHLQMMEDMLRFAGLVMLAGGVVAATRLGPAVSVAPAPAPVISVLPETAKLGKKTQARVQEVDEFAKLPPHIQKQALGYARRWLDANYEPEKANSPG